MTGTGAADKGGTDSTEGKRATGGAGSSRRTFIAGAGAAAAAAGP